MAYVGLLHPKPLYYKVKHQETPNIINACREAGVKKVVMSSSPLTRFIGDDVDGLTEDEMTRLPLKRYLKTYADNKSTSEMAMLESRSDDFMTTSVAPHQAY